MFPIPKRVFLTRGVGVHRQQLAAFEYALRDADIEQQNLVTVSSILPPGCELIPRAAGVATLSPGEITFCVMARSETNEAGRRTAPATGLRAVVNGPPTYAVPPGFLGIDRRDRGSPLCVAGIPHDIGTTNRSGAR